MFSLVTRWFWEFGDQNSVGWLSADRPGVLGAQTSALYGRASGDNQTIIGRLADDLWSTDSRLTAPIICRHAPDIRLSAMPITTLAVLCVMAFLQEWQRGCSTSIWPSLKRKWSIGNAVLIPAWSNSGSRGILCLTSIRHSRASPWWCQARPDDAIWCILKTCSESASQNHQEGTPQHLVPGFKLGMTLLAFAFGPCSPFLTAFPIGVQRARLPNHVVPWPPQFQLSLFSVSKSFFFLSLPYVFFFFFFFFFFVEKKATDGSMDCKNIVSNQYFRCADANENIWSV